MFYCILALSVKVYACESHGEPFLESFVTVVLNVCFIGINWGEHPSTVLY